jgi:hypothetical protein
VAKVIESLNNFDNVLYEIGNECPPTSIQWSYNMIDFIKHYESEKVKQHPVGMTVNFPYPNTSALFASDADWISPGDDAGDYLSNPPEADGSKVIILDSDHITYFDASAGMIWKQFTRGLNPIFMDLAPPLRDKAPLPEQEAIRAAMDRQNCILIKMNLAAMTPVKISRRPATLLRILVPSTLYMLPRENHSVLFCAPGATATNGSIPPPALLRLPGRSMRREAANGLLLLSAVMPFCTCTSRATIRELKMLSHERLQRQNADLN